jgi:hypothetical protein
MAYSMIAWLVDPGKHPQQDEEEEWAQAGRDDARGAATGANLGYTLPRMRYGANESQDEADRALSDISESLQQNRPLRITFQASRQWLLPAGRVHYVVCEEVQRPKDQ